MIQYSHILQFFILILLSIIRSTHQTVYTCSASASCGCSMNSAIVNRIVGGEAASSGTWGWAVSISIADRSLCGGSIISSSWVITAAHCAEGVLASQFIVYAGSNTQWYGTQTRNVSRIILHSGYNPATYENDIALLKLASPLNMSNPYVSSICLPSVSQTTLSAGEWPSVGTNVVAVGWGRLSEGGSLPSTLQQVTMQTVDYRASTCNQTMTDWHVQFCASVPGGSKDTCQGDSGGPLMMFNASNQWVLVGLTSSGIGCARAEYAGMYTRVAAYENWINSNTNDFTSNLSSFMSTTSRNPVQATTTESSEFQIHLHASTIAASALNVFTVALIAFLVIPF
ncbi:unnamed protein product [Rotaria sp. Silwood2]|nr:unnamed protein product [Rotaria sp. Silwood2]CAF4149263.1 unnamed protein product [Rotaria sp. Silwood2]